MQIRGFYELVGFLLEQDVDAILDCQINDIWLNPSELWVYLDYKKTCCWAELSWQFKKYISFFYEK